MSIFNFSPETLKLIEQIKQNDLKMQLKTKEEIVHKALELLEIAKRKGDYQMPQEENK